MIFIIPSGSGSNLSKCLDALYEKEPETTPEKVIVVDDGCGKSDSRATYYDGEKPFNFSRNVNVGLKIALGIGENAVVMGDDTLLETHGGISEIEKYYKLHPEFGIISPGIHGECGSFGQQNKGRSVVYEEKSVLCFICVFIGIETMKTIGLMDESFTGYGYDDVDYCNRAMKSGYKLGVMDSVHINHLGHSVYRNRKDFGDIAEESRKVYVRKYG